MFSPALWSCQRCASNLICGLGECSSCCNFTCCRQDASCCDCSVVYKTGLCGFVWVSPPCMFLPSPFVPQAGFASGAATSRTHCCCGTRDSPGWHLGVNRSRSKSTWGGQFLHMDGGTWGTLHKAVAVSCQQIQVDKPESSTVGYYNGAAFCLSVSLWGLELLKWIKKPFQWEQTHWESCVAVGH